MTLQWGMKHFPEGAPTIIRLNYLENRAERGAVFKICASVTDCEQKLRNLGQLPINGS